MTDNYENLVEKAFISNDIEKVLYDYVQFSTKFLTSVRGGAKTFKVQKKLLNNFFKYKKYFAVLRESQIEVDNMMSAGFWDNNLITKKKYAGHIYETEGNKIKIDGVQVGIAVALTTYGNFRGVALNLGKQTLSKTEETRLENEIKEAEKFTQKNMNYLSTIFFDEFEPLSPKLSGENRYIAFKHIAETLFRLRSHKSVEVIMCGNVEKADNPFLAKFGFDDLKNLTYGIKKTYSAPNRYGKIQPLAVWAHIEQNNAWQDIRDDSYCGMLSRSDGSEIFNTGNITIGIEFKKIPSKPLPRRVMFNLTDGKEILTLWATKKDIFYITEKSKGKSYTTYCFNSKLAVYGIRLATEQVIDALINLFSLDRIEFDNAHSFEVFKNILPSRNKRLKKGA